MKNQKMSLSLLSKATALLLLTGIAASLCARAEEPGKVGRVMRKDGQTVVVKGGAMLPLEEEVTFPNDLKVFTNGTYVVKQGKPRELKEGQSLGADGMLTSLDGSILPVFDHVTLKQGRVQVMRDGVLKPLTGEETFGDGVRVSPDGYVLTKTGRRVRLLDGQLFRLDGGEVPAKDSITFKGGKVTVQKDGSVLSVPPRGSIMMNDGTKVFGDGTVVPKEGAPRKLAEGETLTIEGVVRHMK
jgi:hypothetical protein